MLEHLNGKDNKRFFLIGLTLFAFIFLVSGCSKEKKTAKTQLYYSICNPNVQGVKEALKNDPELAKEKIKTLSKVKALELAVREIESEKIQLQICKQLIKNGADVNEQGKDGDTNLCWAIDNGRYDLAKELIVAGADLNQKGDVNTPLSGVINGISLKENRRKIDMLNELLESGAKPDSDVISNFLKDNNSNSGMQYYFTPKIMKILEESQGDQNISQSLRAAITGNDRKLQKMIKVDKINKKDRKNVLAFAAAYCNVDTLKLMKKQGYDFNWQDSDKVGLLHIAALCNDSSVVKYLLKQGLDPKAKIDYYKANAMDFAIVSGNLDNARILMKAGKINLEKRHTKEQCTTWEFVSAFGSKKAFETLKLFGHQPTKDEIYNAYLVCSEEQYQYLKTIKNSIHTKIDGDGILLGFCTNDMDHHILEICKEGVKATEDELKEMIWSGESSIVRKILEQKMVTGKVSKESLLQSAINVGDYTMVRYLVKQGADINKYVKDGVEDYSWTSFQTACGSESQEILKYLKKNGGDDTKKDSEGRSCKQIAKDNKAVWNLSILE